MGRGPAYTTVSAGTGYGGGVLRPGTGDFIPRGQRWVRFNVEVEVGNLITLGIRMEETLRFTLTRRLGEAAADIIAKARAKLQVKPDDVVTPDGNIYGFDEGLMYASLTARLVESVTGVYYDLEAPGANYWVFVEFGHMLRNGAWWPGYHFLSGTVAENEDMIRQKVREAWFDTTVILAAQARVMGTKGTGGFGGGLTGGIV